MSLNAAGNARYLRLTAVVAITVAVVTAIGLTPGKAADALLGFADFWCGVIALLSFTGAVVWGQISIERRVLTPRHRLLAQAVHRGMGVLGLGSLILHVTAKITYGEASAAAVVPFAGSRERFLVGLGALSLYLMLAAAVSGAARSAFVKRRHPRRWRWLHCASYAGWCSALVHGLKTGRPASTPWVTVGYAACLLAVAAVLGWRATRPAKRWLETTPMDAPGGGHRRAGRAVRALRPGRTGEASSAAVRLERLPLPPPEPEAAAQIPAAPEPMALPALPQPYPAQYPQPQYLPPQPAMPGHLPPPGHAQDYQQTWPDEPAGPPQEPFHPALYQDTVEMPLPKPTSAPMSMPSAGRPW